MFSSCPWHEPNSPTAVTHCMYKLLLEAFDGTQAINIVLKPALTYLTDYFNVLSNTLMQWFQNNFFI